MKAFTSKSLAFFMACLLLLAAVQIAPAAALPPSGALAPTEARRVMDTLGDKLTVIDVRTEGEFAEGHVPGALLLPVQTLSQHLDQVPADRPVLILCRTGHRASAAYDIIRKARPAQERLWFLRGVPVYGADGSFSFK